MFAMGLGAAVVFGETRTLGQTIVQGPVANPVTGHWYYRLSASSWSAAEAAAFAYLGHLVTIDDDAENTFVLDTFANAPGSGRVWIGLSDAANEGVFAWTNLQQPAYTHWEPGEPNGGAAEDWVAMSSGSGNWFDTLNLANPPGVGNIYGVVEVPCAALTVVQGPVFNPANGHYYTLLSSSKWTDAECYAQNVLHGHLVTISDPAENAFVLATFAAPAGRVWIGYTDMITEGTFAWVSGEPGGYTNWTAGEPSNGGGAENWAGMYASSGQWFDAPNAANPAGIGPVSGVVEVIVPPNDSCANAIDVSATGVFQGSLAAATHAPGDGSGSCGDSSTNPDVWFKYTSPCDGRLIVSTCGTHDATGTDSGMDTVISLFSGCGGTELGCNDDSTGGCGGADGGVLRDSLLMRDMTPGLTVYIRVSKFGTSAAGAFRLNVVRSMPNDECAGALPIGPGTTTVCTAAATASGPPQAGCDSLVPTYVYDFFNDVWFRYTPITSGLFTVTTCGAATTHDTVLAAYASCPGAIMPALACDDESCGMGQSRIRVQGTAGSPVLIRLGSFLNGGGVAALNVYCAADYNLSGSVSVFDIFDFLNGWFVNDPAADFNGGGVAIQDIFDFLNAWFLGCA